MSNISNKKLFVHIPRTGGSGLILACAGRKHFELHGHANHAPGYVWLKDRDDLGKYYSFTVVRNPYERLVSAYHALRQPNKFHSSWDRWDASRYVFYGDGLRDFVLGGPLRRAVAEEQRHFLPQWRWVCDDRGNVLVNYVLKYEHQWESPGFLELITGTSYRDMGVVNASKHGRWQDMFDGEMLQLVEVLYREDFEKFNYEVAT